MVKDIDDFASFTEKDDSSPDTAENYVNPPDPLSGSISGIITAAKVEDTEYDDLSEYFNPADIGMLDFDAAKAVERREEEEDLFPLGSDEPASGVYGLTQDPVPEDDGQIPDEEDSGRKKRREKKEKKEKKKAGRKSGDDPSETDDDTTESEAPSRGSKIGTAILWILIALLIGAIAFGAVKLLPLLRTDDSLKVIAEGESISNGTVEVTFDEVNVLGSMLTYQFDPDYVYVSVMYTFKNVSGQDQTWEITPYIMMKPFTKNSNGTVSPLDPEGEEAAELMEIYNSLAPADSFIVPVEGAEDSAAEDSSEEAEDDPLKVLYGTYDFNALQIFSLEKCIEYGSVKDNLPAGGERISADVIKIPRALFETGKYYICMDNQKAAVYIDPTPMDIDAPQTQEQPSQENPPQEEQSEEDDEESEED